MNVAIDFIDAMDELMHEIEVYLEWVALVRSWK